MIFMLEDESLLFFGPVIKFCPNPSSLHEALSNKLLSHFHEFIKQVSFVRVFFFQSKIWLETLQGQAYMPIIFPFATQDF